MGSKVSARYEISLAREAAHRAIGELLRAEQHIIEAQAAGMDTTSTSAEVQAIIKRIERLERSLTVALKLAAG